MKPATELPWTVDPADDLSPAVIEDTEDGYGVAECGHPDDAAYIVHACNLHGELVAALKLVCHALGAWRDGEDINLEELKYMVVDRAIECAEPGFDGGETTLEELRDCIAAWQLTSAKP
jgi:hypothetical protein